MYLGLKPLLLVISSTFIFSFPVRVDLSLQTRFLGVLWRDSFWNYKGSNVGFLNIASKSLVYSLKNNNTVNVPKISALCELIWVMSPKSGLYPDSISSLSSVAMIHIRPDFWFVLLPSEAMISFFFLWMYVINGSIVTDSLYPAMRSCFHCGNDFTYFTKVGVSMISPDNWIVYQFWM